MRTLWKFQFTFYQILSKQKIVINSSIQSYLMFPIESPLYPMVASHTCDKPRTPCNNPSCVSHLWRQSPHLHATYYAASQARKSRPSSIAYRLELLEPQAPCFHILTLCTVMPFVPFLPHVGSHCSSAFQNSKGASGAASAHGLPPTESAKYPLVPPMAILRIRKKSWSNGVLSRPVVAHGLAKVV